jgi:ATP-dependent DNA helicase RecQ
MDTQTLEDRAAALLADLAGPDATFRPHELETVRDLVDDRARVLCVQRTGWWKSAVYFLATALLRERGAGPALIVSPLLALMRNQIAAAERLGIRAHTINSTNRDAWEEVQRLLAEDSVDLLLISPERLNNPQFREEMLPLFVERVGLLVVDEAHCISDWGHDFRPDYRRLAEMLERLPAGVAVLCTTATANDRVVAESPISCGLGMRGSRVSIGAMGRSSLRLEVVDLPGRADRLASLATRLPQLNGAGIVYSCVGSSVRVLGRPRSWQAAHRRRGRVQVRR